MQSRLLVAHASFQVGRQAAVERELIGDMRFFATNPVMRARSSYQIGCRLSSTCCVSCRSPTFDSTNAPGSTRKTMSQCHSVTVAATARRFRLPQVTHGAWHHSVSNDIRICNCETSPAFGEVQPLACERCYPQLRPRRPPRFAHGDRFAFLAQVGTAASIQRCPPRCPPSLSRGVSRGVVEGRSR